MSVQDDLSRLIRPAIETMGFEFVGLEYLSNPKNRLVRIYIDRVPHDGESRGISVDDCAEVSNEVAALLDVEDPVSGHYSLEVSSPGVERPLFEPEHYRRFVGDRAKVHLYAPMGHGHDNGHDHSDDNRHDHRHDHRRDNRRKLTGRIVEADDDRVVIEVDGENIAVAFADIRRANLKPDMDAIMAGR